MKMRAGNLLLILSSLIPGALSLGACASTEPNSSPMLLGQSVLPPPGFVRFCERDPRQCGLKAPPVMTLASADAAPALAPTSLGHASVDDGSVSVTEPALRPTVHIVMENTWNIRPVRLRPSAADPYARTSPFAVEPLQPLRLSLTLEPVAPSQPAAVEAPLPEVTQEAQPAASLAYSPELWSQLTAVNNQVNRAIEPAQDRAAYGADDYWTMPLTYGLGRKGNCKDYVLEKRAALTKMGVPRSAMSIAVVRTAWGEIHAVLVVSTDRGAFVMDNLSPWISGWRQAGYQWLVAQAQTSDLDWRQVSLN